jgi:RNA polymerase sigma-70 factor (ECF subfamily)
LFFKKKKNYVENDLESIIAACLEQDQQAQRALIKMFYGYAKTISMRYGANQEEVQEIVNDGFLKVFSNLGKYDHSLHFKGWLRTIMVNTAIDYYRKWNKYNNHDGLDHIEVVDISDDVISKISANEILKLVQQLPPSYRMVFTLYVVEGYNHREIGDLLGIREGTSKSNLQDARRKLQAMVKNAYPHLYLAYGLKHNKVHEN